MMSFEMVAVGMYIQGKSLFSRLICPCNQVIRTIWSVFP